MDANVITVRKMNQLLIVGMSVFLATGQLLAKKKCRKETKPADFSLIAELRNESNQQDPLNLRSSSSGPIPADPINAVGKNTIITMVNFMIAIYEKDSLTQTFRTGLVEFFSEFDSGPLGNFGDPWVTYDEFSDRFFVVATNFRGVVGLAVSKTGNPRSGDDFFKYQYFVPEENRGNLGDFEKIAVDKEAMYMTYLDANVLEEGVQRDYFITAFDKEPMINGTAPMFPGNIVPDYSEKIDLGFDSDFGIKEFGPPVKPHKACGTKGVEKVLIPQRIINEANPDFATGDTIRINYIQNVLGQDAHRKFVDVKVPTFNITGTASVADLEQVPQPSPVVNFGDMPIIGIDANSILYTGTTRDTSLWIVFVVLSDDGEFRNLTRWYEFDVSKLISHNKAKLVQTGTVDPGNRGNTFWPAINVDKHGNMGISFALAGVVQYPAIAYTGRLKDDPKGTVRLPLQIPVDPNLYYQVTGGGPENRYGDYSGLALDPCDQETFWVAHMYPYPADPTFEQPNGFPVFGFGSMWTTWLGAFRIGEEGKGINAPSKPDNKCKKKLKQVSKGEQTVKATTLGDPIV